MNPVEKRIQGLTRWLNENHPKVSEEQKHLDAGTEARAYWHHGYLMALQDFSQYLRKHGIEHPRIKGNPKHRGV